MVETPEVVVHRRAQAMIRLREEQDRAGQIEYLGPDKVLFNGVDIMRDLKEAKSEAVETGKSPKQCEDNEIYIVDGEHTLLLTNNRVAKDIDTIQESEKNLLAQLRRQDR